MDAVERIEVALRTTISNTLNERHGSYWYKNADLFATTYNHSQLVKLIRKIASDCSEFSNYLPYEQSWIIAEKLPIGVWSKIFSSLKSRDIQKQISSYYTIHYSLMESWLHSFTCLRNICAHHERLWNRNFPVKSKIPKKYKQQFADPLNFARNLPSLIYFSP